MSVVTTLEASDWSVQLRPDAVSLQSKEPLCRAVAGALSASVQRELPQTKEERTTTVKLVPIHVQRTLHLINYYIIRLWYA